MVVAATFLPKGWTKIAVSQLEQVRPGLVALDQASKRIGTQPLGPLADQT